MGGWKGQSWRTQQKQLSAFRSHDLYPGPQQCVRKFFFFLHVITYLGLIRFCQFVSLICNLSSGLIIVPLTLFLSSSPEIVSFDLPGFARLLAIIGGSLRKWFIQGKVTEEALLECQLTLTGLLDDLAEWNSTHDSLVLINSPLDETVSMGILSLNLSLARILEMAVRHCPDMMTNKHWDFVLCVLAGWLQVIFLQNMCFFFFMKANSQKGFFKNHVATF